MAPDVPKWQFTTDPISVPEDVMGKAAQVCADGYVQLQTIMYDLVTAGITNNDPISAVDSGKSLGGEFYSAGLAAYEILKNTRDAFNHFGNAFLQVGKFYNATDQGNADKVSKAGNLYGSTKEADDEFSALVDVSSSSVDLGHKWSASLDAMVKSPYKEPSDSLIDGYKQSRYTLGGSTEDQGPDYIPKTKVPDPVNINDDTHDPNNPTPDQLLARAKQQVSQGVKNPVLELGAGQWEERLRTFVANPDTKNQIKPAAWKKAASDLQGAADTFFTSLTSAVSDWTGKGHDAAIDNAKAFQSGIIGTKGDGLVSQFNTIGDALDAVVGKTSEAIGKIKPDLDEYDHAIANAQDTIDKIANGTLSEASMSNVDVDIHVAEQKRADAINEFDDTYVKAVATASSAIPMLTSPPALATNPAPPPPPDNTGDPNKNKNKNGTPSTPSNPSTPSGSGNTDGSSSASSRAAAAAAKKANAKLAQLEQQSASNSPYGTGYGSTGTSGTSSSQGWSTYPGATSGSGSGSSAFGTSGSGTSSSTDVFSQLGTALSMGQQLLSSLMSTAQSQLQQTQQQAAARLADLEKTPGELADEAKKALTGLAGGGGGGGGGDGLSSPLDTISKDAALASSKLFPRASATLSAATEGELADTTHSVAAAATTGMPGMGMPAMGGAGRGGKDDDKYKRPDYLQSDEDLDEALGDPVVVARPVVDR